MVAGQRIAVGSTIVTGKRSEVVLGFEDGQMIALDENSEFNIRAYSFSIEKPKGDRFVFELRKGALRSISGRYTNRTPSAYALKLEHATIGILGTDFMVALDSATHVSVLKGTVRVKNSAGAAVFGNGMNVTIPSAGALAATIASGAFSPAVQARFERLRMAVVPGSPHEAAIPDASKRSLRPQS